MSIIDVLSSVKQDVVRRMMLPGNVWHLSERIRRGIATPDEVVSYTLELDFAFNDKARRDRAIADGLIEPMPDKAAALAALVAHTAAVKAMTPEEYTAMLMARKPREREAA